MEENLFDDINDNIQKLRKAKEKAMKLLFDESPLESQHTITTQENTTHQDLSTEKQPTSLTEEVIIAPEPKENTISSSAQISENEQYQNSSSESTPENSHFLTSTSPTPLPNSSTTDPLYESLAAMKKTREEAMKLLFDNQPQSTTEPKKGISEIEELNVESELTDSSIVSNLSGQENVETIKLTTDNGIISNPTETTEVHIESKSTVDDPRNNIINSTTEKPSLPVKNLFNTFSLGFDQYPIVNEYLPMTQEHHTDVDRLLEYVSFLEKRFSINENDPLEKFIANEPKLKPVFSTEQKEWDDLSVKSTSFDIDFVTENMAKIYFKQGNTQKALEIYKRLSLKNPQKNAYFAEKISEIENTLS